MRKTTEKKHKLFLALFPFLLIAWILVKLGNFGIETGLLIWRGFEYLFKRISDFKFQISNQILISNFQKVNKTKINKKIVFSQDTRRPFFVVQISRIKKIFKHLKFKSFNFRPKTRGRPRTQPFLRFFYKKHKKLLNRLVPSPLRVASLLTIFLIGFFIYSFALIVIAHDLPSPQNISKIESPQTTEIYDRNGELLYRLYEGKNRTPIELKDLPDYLIDATIAMEDKNFYAHSGVDIFGITRAAISFIEKKEVQQGGSTITQQLIKNTLLTPERTIQRKVKEIILAFWTERIFSKDEILTMYFNEVPYGGPAWGIEAASQTYFDKDTSELTLAESAYLAGLPASPTTYSPYGTNPGLAKLRQKEVLRRMVEDKYISQEQADKAYEENLEIKSPITQIKAPHFVMYVRSKLVEEYGEKMVSQGGLRVYTTLDLKTQKMAEEVVLDEVSRLSDLNVSNGAAMITDAKTGQIIAMVGSKNYWDPNGGNFNVATSLRQPGSSIKPITYATGFKQGYSPGNTLLDTPVTFKNAWETYSPQNYDGRFHGPVTVRTALGSSYNIPAVKMLALVTIPEMIKTAKDLGISSFDDPSRYGLSLTLGGGEVRLLDMMTVYGTFAQNGVRYEAEPILKLTDSKGNVLQDNTKPEGKRVLSAGISYLITDILADNKARTPAFGPQSQQLVIPGHSVAVKTGTTDSKRDNWTFGYTPEVVVGVWVGNNDNSPMNPALTSGVTGAAPIWNKLMNNILRDREAVAFTKPSDIAQGMVDGHKDLVLAGTTNKSVVGQGKRKIKDEKDNHEKDVITFTDPFSGGPNP